MMVMVMMMIIVVVIIKLTVQGKIRDVVLRFK